MLYSVKYYYDPALSYTIIIKYRRYDELHWTDISQPPWRFAERIWGDEYHYNKSDTYGRFVFVRTVLDERYNGKLEEYVFDIVKYDVLEKRAEMEEKREIDMILSRLDTHGWRKHTIEIEDNA